MSAPTPGLADPSSSYRAIEKLIMTYAELVNDGNFAGLGTLIAAATFTGGGAPVSGADAIQQMFRNTVIVYADGTPRTGISPPTSSSRLTRSRERLFRGRTSPPSRRCPTCRCNPSPAAVTATAFRVATGSGASWNDKSALISPATSATHLRPR